MRCFHAVVVLILLSGLASLPTQASHVPADYRIPYVDADPDIDGELNESVWQQAAQVELKYETQPGDNLPARVKTVAYFFENGEHVYVAFVAEEPDIEQLRAYYNDRDQTWGDDQVSIMIDTFNDQRRAYQFFVNPLGIQSDSIIDQVNDREDLSWNAIWDSAGQITEQGYVVEMAIPLRALRFDDRLPHQIWGIEFIRFWPRENRYRFSNITRAKKAPCGLCELSKLEGLANVVEANNFEWVPTLTLARSKEREELTDDQWQASNDSELGVDFRWGINQDMYLNATINPDFSQVEADSAQLSVNTQFSLFYPEKRTFFLDGADYFQSPNRLVHTRNVADPDYGLKLTGKNGRHSYGVILANDTQTSFLLPSSQGSSLYQLDEQSSEVFIARWRQDVGDKSTWGLLTTHRTSESYHNSVVAVDGNFWWSSNDYIQFQWMASDSQTPMNEDVELSRDDAYSIRYQHQETDWEWHLNHVDFGREFRADLGFINRVDFTKSAAGIRRNWFFDGDGFLTHFNIYSDYDITFDQSNKKLEEEFEIWFNFEGAHQFQGWFGGGRRHRFASNSFELEYLPEGVDPESPDYQPQYHSFELADYFFENFYGLGAEVRPYAFVKFGLRVKFGDSIDFHNVLLGKNRELKSQLEWRPSQKMKLSLNNVWNTLELAEGELFEANLTDLRLSYQFDRRHRMRASVQYLDLDRDPSLHGIRYRIVSNPQEYRLTYPDAKFQDLALQLVYSYKVNPQTLVYLGYSSYGYQTDDLTQIETQDKNLFAKFSYAFQY